MRHSQLRQTIAIAHSIRRPLLIWGSPGLGKSMSVNDYAASIGLPVIDWPLTLMDQVDMRGTPNNKREIGFTHWDPPGELPREGKGILFLDELAQASMQVKNAAARLVLEGRIGEWKLPPGWWVCAASNRMTDAAGTSPMPKQLNNRFWHVDLDLSHSDWFEWAETHGVDYRVIAYLKYAEAALFEFDPKSSEAAFPTPRSWTDGVSDIMKKIGEQKEVLALDPALLNEMVSGNVGKVRGGEFVGFLRVLHSLTSMDRILSDPQNAPIAKEPSVRYALATGLTRAVDKKTLSAAFIYMQRMSKEFAFVFARKLEREQPELRKTKPFVDFVSANADYL